MGGRGASSSNTERVRSTSLKKGDIIGNGQRITNIRESTVEKDGKTSTNIVDKDTIQNAKVKRGATSSNNINTLQREYDRIKNINIKLYNDNNGFAITGDLSQVAKRNTAYKKWLKNRDKLGKLTQKINGLKDAQKKNEQPTSNKAFVNSYGEATKRNITSSTYEKQQRRRQRQVLRNMGY